VPGVTEIQAGGGVFGDILYESWGVSHPFALTVLSTVTSRPTSTRIIVDAGRKTMSTDGAMPRPIGGHGAESVRFSAEHGKIELRVPSSTPKVGDKLEWVVGYGDTTVCLHDEMVGIRGGKVEVVWPVAGRGKLT
jgi:D-serine deaminase-like pyridoxal phosphate-dependent protein